METDPYFTDSVTKPGPRRLCRYELEEVIRLLRTVAWYEKEY
jgi:hypothetical protein